LTKRLTKPRIEKLKRRGVTSKYFVVRDANGKWFAGRKVKGSRMTLTMAKETFKKNKTFFEDKKRLETTNTTQYIQTKNIENLNHRPIPRPRLKRNRDGTQQTLCYVISGVYVNGRKSKMIYGSSDAVYSRFPDSGERANQLRIHSNAEAVEQAKQRFLGNLSNAVSGRYDADEGEGYLNKIKRGTLQGGWQNVSKR
jgi:hypothetical protein